ncbi:MAG TPA: hypothetical protein VFE59_15020 [Trebonia sp.]|jgi:hypothetical protein|nr:hypothetical protein [Trebonia sp.]
MEPPRSAQQRKSDTLSRDRGQAWREVSELPGRTLMRDGVWLT